MVSTTPRPTPLIKRLLGETSCAVTRAETKANAANLADGFIGRIEERYGGTAIGRQELEGALVDDVPGAWLRRFIISACHCLHYRDIIALAFCSSGSYPAAQ